MDIPILCSCGRETIVDWTRLEKRPITNLIRVEGYTCRCGKWVSCWYSTRQLEESLCKLESMRPEHANFLYYFGKALRRAEEIQKRGELIDGAF